MAHWSDFLDPDGPDGAYLPWKKIEPRVGISRTTAWRLQRTGDFPKPYVMSPGRVAYRESEVEAWKASRGHRSATTMKARATSASRPPDRPAATPEPPVWTPAATPEPLALEPPPVSPPIQMRRPRGRVRRAPPCGDQMTLDF